MKARKLSVGIVVPTIDGRFDSLDRCILSYEKVTWEVDIEWRIEYNHPTCGSTWNAGVRHFLQETDPHVDMIHLTSRRHRGARGMGTRRGCSRLGMSALLPPGSCTATGRCSHAETSSTAKRDS